MVKKNVGAALTAVPDDEDTPLRSIMSGAGDALLGDENSRRALLQIGLQMMQPVAMGQSVVGHIGQGIGAGGEAVGRIEAEELKRKKQEDELDIAQRGLDIKAQDLASYAKGIGLKNLIDRQALQTERLQHAATLAGNKDYIAMAKAQLAALDDPYGLANKDDPVRKKYAGKDIREIAEIMRQEDLARGGGGAGPTTKSRDDEALEWARANPSDPRAAKIRQRLGM